MLAQALRSQFLGFLFVHGTDLKTRKINSSPGRAEKYFLNYKQGQWAQP
jgi:hypothetical protein